MPTTNDTPDITNVLHTVHGGNAKTKAIAAGAKAAYNTVRPWVSKAADAVDTVGKLAGGAWAAKEAWDHFTGKDDKPAPAQP